MKIFRKLILALSLCGASALPTTAQNKIDSLIANPSFDAKPWTFWYWMYGAVTEPAITADLEAMASAGLGGAYLMPIYAPEKRPEHGGTVRQLSPEWWKTLRYTFNEAERLGLKLGMHVCDGFALAGGPWITPAESMQKVVFADTIVKGGRLQNIVLPTPTSLEGYYKDIALYALPVKGGTAAGAPSSASGAPSPSVEGVSASESGLAWLDSKLSTGVALTPKMTVKSLVESDDAKKMVNVDASGTIRSSLPCWIEYAYEQPITVRNVQIILSGNNYQAHRLKVMASDNGVDFRLVKQLIPARQGWQNTDEQTTHAIPATTARYFRFYWTPENSEPGSEDMDAAKWKPNLKIKQIVLHSEPRLNQWEGKAGLVWRVAHDTSADEITAADCVQLSEVIDLTKKMKRGRLTTTLPEGEWRLLRMGHTSTGHVNPTGGTAKGLECDKFDRKAVRKQFDNWFGRTFKEVGPVAKRVLKYFHVDSWECGSQNWSENFAREFKTRRGYDLMPYLPLLAGVPMESAAKSEMVLRDVRETMGELVHDVFYTVLAECAEAYDCKFSAECVNPTMVSDGLMHYNMVDYPMGEFWLRSPTHDKPNDMLDAISGAHIYGKNIIQAEGFTEVRGTWDESPATVKTLLDRNYALGINRLFYHVYTHNPYMDRRPGMTLDGIGFFFQRDNTWWKHGAKAMSDYMTRCQALLQYGVPVVDIAVFTGEEMPRRSILPDRLVNQLPGIFGKERVESERVRLANVGQPLRVKPVGVTHSANMADPEAWINPLRGYQYDSFNKDALLRLATAKDGRLNLPGGASYKVFVLPKDRPMNPNNVISPEAQAKIDEMKAAGVIVPSLPYTADDFSAFGLERDLVVPENVAWTHRRNDADNIDIYFLSNQEERERVFTASFRIAHREPRFYDAMKDIFVDQVVWRTVGDRIEADLRLAAGASLFVIFGKKTNVSARIAMEEIINCELKTGEWKVRFLDIDKEITTRQLFDWSLSDDERIRYYSGTAVYSGTFQWYGYNISERRNARVIINLGTVCDVAAVKVNGKECGIAWTSPYEVDITDAVAFGDNTIEIEVSNTWANALNGADCGKAPFDGIWTNAKYRMASKELLPAGLIGPLKLKETNIYMK